MLDETNKCFVFDLDGTIIIDNKPLENLIDIALQKIIQAGHNIIFSTARSIRGVSHVLPDWYLNNIIIYCNGAFAYENKKCIYSKPINPTIVFNLLKIIEALDNSYYLELGDFYFHPNNRKHYFYNNLKEEGPNEYINDKNYILEKPIYKIVILENNNKVDFKKLISKKFNNNLEVYYHSDGTIDIVEKNCTKWSALSHIISDKYKNNVVSFGNDLNDYDMLKNSKLGIAVNPQNEKLKEISNIIINSQNSKDLIDVIKHLL